MNVRPRSEVQLVKIDLRQHGRLRLRGDFFFRLGLRQLFRLLFDKLFGEIFRQRLFRFRLALFGEYMCTGVFFLDDLGLFRRFGLLRPGGFAVGKRRFAVRYRFAVFPLDLQHLTYRRAEAADDRRLALGTGFVKHALIPVEDTVALEAASRNASRLRSSAMKLFRFNVGHLPFVLLQFVIVRLYYFNKYLSSLIPRQTLTSTPLSPNIIKLNPRWEKGSRRYKRRNIMAKEKMVEQITNMETDFAQWYTDICRKAELVEYASVKGFTILRPYGYAIWENIQQIMDGEFKKTGHQNVAMPVLIPESLLKKEGELVNGFAPEVAWVTKGGSEELEEPLAFRPTSETMFCDHWSRVLHSYRELPMLYNQWCSVIRWEKTTRPFLRSREFWWQEGHTIHETAEEAEAETAQQLKCYADFFENILAIPVVPGRKTENVKSSPARRPPTPASA